MLALGVVSMQGPDQVEALSKISALGFEFLTPSGAIASKNSLALSCGIAPLVSERRPVADLDHAPSFLEAAFLATKRVVAHRYRVGIAAGRTVYPKGVPLWPSGASPWRLGLALVTPLPIPSSFNGRPRETPGGMMPKDKLAEFVALTG